MSQQLELNSIAICISRIKSGAGIMLDFRPELGWIATVSNVHLTVVQGMKVLKDYGKGPTAEAALYALWSLLTDPLKDTCVIVIVEHGRYNEVRKQWNSVEARWDVIG